jgi:hypothetical protein
MRAAAREHAAKCTIDTHECGSALGKTSGMSIRPWWAFADA